MYIWRSRKLLSLFHVMFRVWWWSNTIWKINENYPSSLKYQFFVLRIEQPEWKSDKFFNVTQWNVSPPISNIIVLCGLCYIMWCGTWPYFLAPLLYTFRLNVNIHIVYTAYLSIHFPVSLFTYIFSILWSAVISGQIYLLILCTFINWEK